MPAIYDITVDDIRSAVRDAVRWPGRDELADFVASIDWSSPERWDGTEVADLLARVEGWHTLFSEGQIDRTEYVARLISLIVEAEDDE